MKPIALFCLVSLITTAIQAQIIHVPADFPAIQQAIDTANNGDTVLVSPGTYLENINFHGKNITVASLFLTTQDTSYIPQTIIDGNPPGSMGGSVVTLDGNYDSTTLLCGFSIKDGNAAYGGGIYLGAGCYQTCSPSLRNLIITNNTAQSGGGICCEAKVAGWWHPCGGNVKPFIFNVTLLNNKAELGGGIFLTHYCSWYWGCSYSNAEFQNVMIRGNSASQAGGGIYLGTHEGSGTSFRNVTIKNNIAFQQGGGIYFACRAGVPEFDSIDRCNIYQNAAFEGNDLFSEIEDTCIVKLDTFSVLIPTKFHAAPLSKFSFNILHGYHEQVNADLYVSPAGDDSNSGLSAHEPVKTLHCAISSILADSLNPHGIHLLEGIYSHSANGDFFPVNLPDYITLAGINEALIILDAEHTAAVIRIKDNFSNHLSGMKISGGNGSGISCENSSPVMQNLIISDNDGTGIFCSSSSLTMQNLVISNNTGTGISCDYSNPVLQNLVISNNNGGIFCSNSSPILKNVTITGNTASGNGGGIYCFHDSHPYLMNSLLYYDLPQEICFDPWPWGHPNSITISYSDIQGGQDSIVTNNNGIVNWWENIDEDPLLSFNGKYPYALSEDSPCIDAGTPFNSGLPPRDILGNYRFWDGNGDGMAIVDIGAYEYGQPATIHSVLTDMTVCLDDHLVFIANTDGILPVGFRWQKDDGNIPGANDSILVISHVQAADSGSYRLIVSNSYGSDTSNTALVKIILVVQPSEIAGKTEVKENEPVPYSVFKQTGHTYEFSVTGGTKVASTDTTVTVQWGIPGLGYVYLAETDENGCKADTVSLKVSIYGLGIENPVSGSSQLAVRSYPNPVIESVTFFYELNEPSRVTLRIYNSFGQLVDEPVNEVQQEGDHKTEWYAGNLSAGVYFYRIQVGNMIGSGKVIKL